MAYALFLATLPLFGCNKIWEDRDICPTVVSFNTDKENSTKSVNLWVFDSFGNLLLKDSLSAKALSHKEFKIKRGATKLYLWANIGKATKEIVTENSLKALSKRGGVSADSLYFFENQRVLTGDTSVINVHWRKNFATVTVEFLKAQKLQKIEMDVVCPGGGFYIDGNEYRALSVAQAVTSVEVVGHNSLTFRALRQADLAKVYMNVRFTPQEGKPEQTLSLPIGEMLCSRGYDMREDNLQDIDIQIDLALLSVTLKVGNWYYTAPIKINF